MGVFERGKPKGKLVWFAQAMPRQAFIFWLAIKDLLATGVRMRNGVSLKDVFSVEKED